MAEAVLDALEQRFLGGAGRRPDADQHHRRRRGDREGLCHLAHEGLIARVIGGNFGLQLPFMRMVRDELIAAYNFPRA